MNFHEEFHLRPNILKKQLTRQQTATSDRNILKHYIICDMVEVHCFEKIGNRINFSFTPHGLEPGKHNNMFHWTSSLSVYGRISVQHKMSCHRISTVFCYRYSHLIAVFLSVLEAIRRPLRMTRHVAVSVTALSESERQSIN
jgi:hypothetical protein